MFLRPSRSIRAKLVLLITISVGAAVLLSFAIGTYRELTRFGEAKRAEMEATANVLAANVADAVATGNRAAASRVINSIGRIPGVRFAQIQNQRGRIFAEAGTGVALVSGAGRQAGATSLWRMLKDGSFYVRTDIVKAGVKVGTVGILVDTSELTDRLRQALAAAAWSAIAAILIGLLIASRLQRSITKPLVSLARTMNEVRLTSDFSQRAERTSDDETGQLVESFNDMLGQIRDRDTALEAHRAGLERTVEERTHDLAEARDAAESANRAKSDFLATMSHEIRTPMNGMLVMAELLAGTELPARQQRYAETIVRSGQTLLTIINDILDLSKIEAGKMELEHGRVPLGTVVDDVLGLFFDKACSKSLDLAAEIGAEVPRVVEADPVRLSQILSNLVNNALKFTESGHVVLSVESRGAGPDHAELTFRVRDTGIGIPPDKVDHIFEAFSQADQSTTRRFGGTGLGLSICQKLVSAMGGRIWVESEPGQGSTFAFTVTARVLEPSPTVEAGAGGAAVVAVAGEATYAVLSRALGEAGYTTLQASHDLALAGVEVVFASAEWIEAAHLDRRGAGARPAIICVAGFGDGDADRLLGTGAADALLAQPVSSVRVREMLQAVRSGSLASLAQAGRKEPGAELPELCRLHVLVADDSAVNREVVSEALSRLRAQTSTVEDGVQAVEAFRAGGFDIVLMDCSMPNMDGFAATRAIRAFEAEQGLKRTPIVALTAHMAGGAAESWHDAGMDDYLTKPFTIRSLATCLARWQPEGRPMATAADDSVAVSEPADIPVDTSSAGPLDPAVLDSLRAIAGGSSAMLDKIFRIFQAHAPARLAALQEACALGDLERIASEAHALKSPSLNIGAVRLGALCGELERRARVEDPTLSSVVDLPPIEAELAAVMAATDAERGAEPGIPVSPPQLLPARVV